MADLDDIAFDAMMDEMHSAQADEWRESLGSEVEASVITSFLEWQKKPLQAAMELNKSKPRATHLFGLTMMADYQITQEPDGPPLPVLLGRTTGETTHPMWSPHTKPTDLGHVVRALVKKDLCDLDGASLKLTATGVLYVHRLELITLEQVFDYWQWTKRERTQRTSNPFWLGGRPPVDEDYQFKTPGQWKFPALVRPGRTHSFVEGYAKVSALKLADALTAAHGKEATECLTFLRKSHERRDVIEALLKESDVPEFLMEDTIKTVQNLNLEDGSQVDRLVEWHATTHPVPPGPEDSREEVEEWALEQSRQIVEELICRAAWQVIRAVMHHRMNDQLRPPQSFSRVGDRPPLATRSAVGSFGTSAAFAALMLKQTEQMQAFANAVSLPIKQVEQALKKSFSL